MVTNETHQVYQTGKKQNEVA